MVSHTQVGDPSQLLNRAQSNHCHQAADSGEFDAYMTSK